MVQSPAHSCSVILLVFYANYYFHLDGTERHEESLLLEQKREQLRLLREAKARLNAKLGCRSPIAGRKRPLSSPVTLPPKRHPLITMVGENSPRLKLSDALSLVSMFIQFNNLTSWCLVVQQ